MRALVVSDLHVDIDHNDWQPLAVDCDVVIVAGDACAPMTLALPWLRTAWPNLPILYVPGNHDFYSDHTRPETKTTYERQRELAPKLAESLDINLLDDSGVILDGVRVLGSTLWTRFDCRPPYMPFADAVRGAMRMNDYRAIKTGAGGGKDRLKPADTINAHKTAVRWLETQLAIPHEGPTVIMTHHAPSPKSLIGGGGFVSHDLDWCYASDLEHLMHGDNAPSLWIHGHIHTNQDYAVGGCRVLCNPRGYPRYAMKNSPRENPGFIEDLVIEIGRDLTPTWRL
jgi:predicted phosphodiesterase